MYPSGSNRGNWVPCVCTMGDINWHPLIHFFAFPSRAQKNDTVYNVSFHFYDGFDKELQL